MAPRLEGRSIRNRITRPWRVIAAAFLVAAALGPSAAAAQRAELEKIIHRRVLPNGLEVIVIENHGVPLATIEIDVKNGSFTQTPEYAGLAHLYEHMFFKANATYPDAEAFLDRAGELGASFNASTTEEDVNYYLTVSADSLAPALKFMAAAVKTPLFRRDEIEREREVVIGEYDRQESSPFFKLQQEMTKRLYPGQFSRKNVIGDRQVVQTATPEKMKAIQRKYYVPNNAALVITGDVTPARVFDLAAASYGDWQRAPDPFAADPIPPVQPLTKSDAVIIEEPVGAVQILLQWQGPSVGKDPAATYAADVFSDVLNAPTSGLQRRLVDTGLFQSVLVNYYTLNQNGPISISGQTSPEKLKRALAALDHEIARFTEPGYLTKEELDQVKAHRAFDSALGRERASGFAHTVGFWWAVASLEYYMGYVDNMATRTLEDLRSYAGRYIVGKPHVTGVVIAPEARRAIGLTAADLGVRGAQ